MSLLSDVDFVFMNIVAALTPNGQFLGCATVAFSERYIHRQWNPLHCVHGMASTRGESNNDVNISVPYMIQRR
jgi:hypothetical protein